MRRFKYFIVTFGLLFLLLSVGAKPTRATWLNNTISEFLSSISVGVAGGLNAESGGMGFHHNEIWSWVADIIGLCDDASDPNCPAAVSTRHSAIAGLNNASIAIITNPPANTYYAFQDMGQSFGFATKKIHAQGVGFSGLAPMLGLWKAFRNVSYLLLAVILVITGFMVMFRKKIDPKTVVTVQNSIPRIVIALFLITFSYAIVGFMIDLMYFSIVLISSLLTSGSSISATQFSGQIIGGGFWGFAFGFFSKMGTIFTGLYDLFTGNNTTAQIATPIVSGLFWGLVTGSLKGGALGGTLLSPPGILFLIIAAAMLFGFVRLVFLLIDAYINIILSLITAPLHLMLEAVPGSNAFSSWFKNLIAKLAVFPVTSTLILIAGILTSYDSQNTPLWAPPFLSKGGGTYGIGGLIGLGMLLIVPNIAGAIQKALKAEPAIPGGLGPIFGPIGSAAGSLMNMWYQGSMIASMTRHKPDARTPMQTVREGAEKGISGITGGGSGH